MYCNVIVIPKQKEKKEIIQLLTFLLYFIFEVKSLLIVNYIPITIAVTVKQMSSCIDRNDLLLALAC